MASLREKVEAELEQMDQALRELPGARRIGRHLGPDQVDRPHPIVIQQA